MAGGISWYVDKGQARVVARIATHTLGGEGSAYVGFDGYVYGDEVFGSVMAVCCGPTTTDGRMVLGVPITSRTLSASGNVGTMNGVDLYEFEYDHPEMHEPTIAQTETCLSGGVPALWDGEHFSELGFHFYPWLDPTGVGITDIGGSGGGSMTAGGVYQWKFVYEWLDSHGNRHQSAPSIVYEHTLGGAETQAYMYVSTLTLTERQDAENERQPVYIVGYRTEASGSIFYRENSIPVTNDLASDYLYYQSTVPDSALLDQEVLYTDGEVAPNFQPPAFRHVVQHDRRLWGISRDDPTLLWVSKTLQSGAEVPGFALQQIIRSEEGGAHVALASVGTSLLAFKQEGVYQYVGHPPNDLNQGGSLNGPIPVALHTGCITPKSVVHCPNGVAFLGKDSFWLIDRSLQAVRIGGAVEDTVESYPYCHGAALDQEHEYVLFSMSDGTAPWGDNPTEGVLLCWHYLTNEWTVWKLPSAAYGANEPSLDIGMCWRGGSIDGTTPHVVQADGTVVYFDGGFDDHDGSDPVMRVDSPWLSFAGVAGFQRVRRLQLRGTMQGSHSVLARLTYDFESEPFCCTRSLAFDGVDDIATTPHAPSLSFDWNTNSWTWSAWIKTSAYGTTQTILGKRQAGGNGWYASVSSSGRLTFELIGTSSTWGRGSTTINDGEWHHVAGRWDADGTNSIDNLTLWVDGVEETFSASQQTLSGTIVNANAFTVGAMDTIDSPFTGNICHVYLWDSAVTDAEIAIVAGNGLGRPPSPSTSGLTYLECWQLGNDVDFPTANASGAGFDMTLTNMSIDDIRLDVPSGVNAKCHDPDSIASLTDGREEHVGIHVPWQKCKAIRVIVETQAVSTPRDEASVRWETLAFEVAGKQGLFKLPDSNRG